jgi:serine/threonine protein kinase
MNRVETHRAVASSLSLLGDAELATLLAGAKPVGTGIGGTVATIEVSGARVFIKTVRLTDLERLPHNVHSTANLFALPRWYQYGVGSAGFGVWRELAAHQLTTQWVLSGACERFPLLYHWRVMPRVREDNTADVERQVAAWEGSPSVRTRLIESNNATASVVLFLEYFPHTLRSWLRSEEGKSQMEKVERELLSATTFLSSQRFVHFDAHFANILTDGEHLYLSDFGLTLSAQFTLTPEESRFLALHRDFDRSCVVTLLVGFGGNVDRYGPIAAVMNEFFRKLRAESKNTPYPADELSRLWSDVG